jgi:hypothetical protein
VSAKSQTLSAAKHFLLSAYGGKWKEVTLAMFTVYVDDSGTSPSQRIAVASALIIPARRIEALESEWGNLRRKYGFTDLHASECAAGWDDEKVYSVFARTCAISKKYGLKAMSYALKKADYDEALSEEWKRTGGRYHYTWAVRWLIRQLEKWHANHDFSSPFEFVFDWPESNKSKEEIERVMAQEESANPGRYQDHYVFRHREQLAGLQGVDLLAWSCFQGARKVFEGTPINAFAKANLSFYLRHPQIARWIEIYTDENKQSLLRTLREDQSDSRSNEQRQRWLKEYAEGMKKKGRSLPKEIQS